MQVVFRADASARIGTGHVIRCLTLARDLDRRGAQCRFVQRAHDGHLAAMIRDSGFEVLELPPPPESRKAITVADYAAWLGVPSDVDASQTLELLKDSHCDWLVVDHYALDDSWEQLMRKRADRILVIDDMANRNHDCDLLIDQNYYSAGKERYKGLLPRNAEVLVGPRYALLGDRYQQARPEHPRTEQAIRRVLIYYGGVDPTNETARALRVLSRPDFSNLEVDVVVGINNPHRQEIRQLAERRPNTQLHGQQKDLVDMMLAADLALGAGGTTTWERCCLGLPGVVTTIAVNQVPYNRELARDNLIVYAGEAAELSDDRLASVLEPLIEKPETLTDIAQKGWQLVDGWGSLRLAEKMLPTAASDLQLRQARPGDSLLFFTWANDPTNRSHSFDSTPIDWLSHDRWFSTNLERTNAWLWVLTTPDGLPVGEAHITKEQSEPVLSFCLDADFRGRCWGTQFLGLIGDRWRREETGLELKAEILKTNPASRRCFETSGCFRPTIETATTWKYSLET